VFKHSAVFDNAMMHCV